MEQLLYFYIFLNSVSLDFLLSSAQLLEFKYALDLTKYLDKEEDYVPWNAAYNSIEDLIKILPRTGKVYKRLMVSSSSFTLLKI